MRSINICHKEYPFKITLGTLEDLEKRGYSLQSIGSMESLSITFMIDIIELACGIDRAVIEQLPLTELGTLTNDVSEALNDCFEPAEGSTQPGEE